MKEAQADSEVLGRERSLPKRVTEKQSNTLTSAVGGTQHSTPADHKCLRRQARKPSCPQKTPPLTAQKYPPMRGVHPRPVWPCSLPSTVPEGERGKHPPRALVTVRNSTEETEPVL